MSGMLAKTADIMFVLENEAIEFIRDTYTVYVKVNKAYEKADANKMDFEALAQGQRNESVKNGSRQTRLRQL